MNPRIRRVFASKIFTVFMVALTGVFLVVATAVATLPSHPFDEVGQVLPVIGHGFPLAWLVVIPDCRPPENLCFGFNYRVDW